MHERTATAPRFKGQSIELGGQEYIVPPLALGAVKELLPRIQGLRSIDGIPSADDLDTMIDTVHAAIVRNYPDLSREALLEMLDLGNIKAVFPMIMGRSGFEAAAGNAPRGTDQP
jgi:hypothetical protein